jgi:hypothetical protein
MKHSFAALQHKRHNRVLNKQVSKEDADGSQPGTCHV